VFIFQGFTIVWFYELHYREKRFIAICCALHRNELYTGPLNSGYLLAGACRQKLNVEWHWLKFFLSQIFLHFGQFYFYSRHVCNTRLVNWTAITDTLTLNGFTRNPKHGFNSWKWPNLAWNSFSTLAIYFSILPLCGLQVPLREKHSLSFWHFPHVYIIIFVCLGVRSGAGEPWTRGSWKLKNDFILVSSWQKEI